MSLTVINTQPNSTQIIPFQQSSLTKPWKGIAKASSHLARNVRSLSRRFFDKGPPTVEFQTVPLSSLQVSPSIPLFLDKDRLLQTVFKTYKIEPTKWCRSYPPLGINITLSGVSNDGAFIDHLQNLFTDLINYATINNCSLSVSHLTFPPSDSAQLYELLDQIVGDIFPALRGISLYSKYPYNNSFADDELVCVSNEFYEDRWKELGIGISSIQKPVFCQFHGENSLGCTCAMLLHELETPESVFRSIYKFTDLQDIEKKLKTLGFQIIMVKCFNLEQLRQAVLNQPGIVNVNSFKLQPHYVVLDEVLLDRDQSLVVIRDPYHKWRAAIKGEAFLKKWISYTPLVIIKHSWISPSSIYPNIGKEQIHQNPMEPYNWIQN